MRTVFYEVSDEDVANALHTYRYDYALDSPMIHKATAIVRDQNQRIDRAIANASISAEREAVIAAEIMQILTDANLDLRR